MEYFDAFPNNVLVVFFYAVSLQDMRNHLISADSFQAQIKTMISNFDIYKTDKLPQNLEDWRNTIFIKILSNVQQD